MHKRTVTRRLIASEVSGPRSFEWLCEMRCYFDPRNPDVSVILINLLNIIFTFSCDHRHDLGSPTIDYTHGKCKIPLWI